MLVGDALNHAQLGDRLDVPGFRVDFNAEIARRTHSLAGCSEQGGVDCFKQNLALDSSVALEKV